MNEQPTYLDSSVNDVEFGPGVKVVRPVNLYGCQIGAGSFIGPFCEIQRGASVGNRCKVQSHSFICDMVEIGDDCFIGHGVMFVNDRFLNAGPAGGKKEFWERTVIGRGVSIGSNATLLPVKVADGVVIGAGSVVTRDLLVKGVYAGNPAILMRAL